MTIDLTIIGLASIINQFNMGGVHPVPYDKAIARMSMQYLYKVVEVLDVTYPISTIHCSN